MTYKRIDPGRPITREKLRELFRYDPCSGKFWWKIARQGASSYKPAGVLDKRNGYRRVTVDGVSYMASRLAWIYVYGEQPDTIDHIDKCRSNDAIWNLANGTESDNMRNSTNYLDGRARKRNERRNPKMSSYTLNRKMGAQNASVF